MFSRFFIDRPILAAVFSVFIVIAGLAAMRTLPIAQYPEIAPPVVTVRAVYPGASASVLEQTVAAPLENQINGVEDMIYMSSSSTSQGVVEIQVTFDIGADVDKAALNVNNRVKQAEPRLPQEVRRQGVTVEKGSSAFLQVLAFYSPDGRFDDLYTSNYVTLNVLDILKRVPGTTNVQIFGAKDYAMRIWVRPDRMAQLKLTPNDLIRAINEQNAQFAPGKVGQSPSPNSQELVYTITTQGRLAEPREFENIILRADPDGATLRVWVAGCSTGEEAYSLAILIREYVTKRKLRLTVQIFASDLDGRSIETARAGLYPAGIAEDITPERLQRFFTKEDGSYRVKKEIRDLVVFATHNILTDAPFTKLDLLSCRNLLIYLEAKAQQKLLPLFHYALKPKGILFLGSAETIGGCERLFNVVDRKWKLFRRTAELGTFPRLERFPGGLMKGTSETRSDSEISLSATPAASIPDLIQQLLVTRFAPATVIVNERGEVVYIHGHTGAYLEPAPGRPTHHLIEMAREGLQHDLALALRQAASREDEVVCHAVKVKANGHVILVDLTVKRIAEPEALQGLFLVTFDQVRTDKTAARKGAPAREAAPLKKGESGLMQELQFTKQRLKRTIEELQRSNEELKSANEEMQSTNEELQSTNEELETAKEELQSLNEELVTVNSELQGKLDALSDANDDLQNLLNGTGIATIFLDNDLRIKRFTSEAKRVSNLIAIDVGRPLSDIVSKLTYERLLEDAQDVLSTLVVKEKEVQAADGSWFLMRILPYRTSRNSIDGLVLTFLDITKRKEAEQVIEAARAVAASIVETVREPLLVLDDHLRVVLANKSFYRMFQLTAREVEQQLLYNLCDGAWNIPDLRSLLEGILPKRTSFEDFIVDKTFPRIGHRVLALNGRRLEQETGLPGRILLAMEEEGRQEGASGQA